MLFVAIEYKILVDIKIQVVFTQKRPSNAIVTG